jgi:hypothetical protein
VDILGSRLQADPYNGADLPRPTRSGLLLAAVGLIPLTLGLADVIRPLSGIVFAGIFVAAGALQWSLAYFELVGVRRRADLELRSERRPFLLSSFAQARATELTSEPHRAALAREVMRTVRDLSPSRLPGASPLNRVAARPHVDLFVRLAERLAAVERPVTPQGVLQVKELMTSPSSPLYARERAAEIRPALLRCLATLESRDPSRRYRDSANGIGDFADDASSAAGKSLLDNGRR